MNQVFFDYYYKNMSEYSIRPQYDNLTYSLAQRERSAEKIRMWDAARKAWEIEKTEKNKLISVRSHVDQLEEAKRILLWIIDTKNQTGLSYSFCSGLTINRVEELYNITRNDFDRLYPINPEITKFY